MNKKACILAVALLTVCTVSAFSWGIGIQAGYNTHIPGNIAVTFKLDGVPLVFAGNFYLGGDYFAVGLTGDYWILNDNFAGPFNYFVGVGLGASVGFGDEFSFDAAFRVPIGINAFFAKKVIEPYIQIVPGLGLGIVPSITARFELDAAIGIRFWF